MKFLRAATALALAPAAFGKGAKGKGSDGETVTRGATFLNAANFDKRVLGKGKAAFVKFQAPW
jgi:hypothetical protein